MLHNVFKSSMSRKSIKESDLYDWEKESVEEESMHTATQNSNNKQSPIGLVKIYSDQVFIECPLNNLFEL